MFETLGAIIILLLIIAGFKMFRGCMCYFRSCGSVYERDSDEELCDGKYPFYMIIITTFKYSMEITEKIQKCKNNNSFVVIVVKDDNIYSDYTEQVKKIVQSLLNNNNIDEYHPIIAFKTSEEYVDHFLDEFPEVCMITNFDSLDAFQQKYCPSNDI